MNLTELFTDKQTLVTYKEGPQFKARGGVAIALLAVSLLVLSIYLYIIGFYYLFILPIPVAFALAIYALDFRGVQIDYKTKQIREYKTLFNRKTGQWYRLSDFKELHLKKDYAIDKTGLENVYRGSDSVTYHYYLLFIADPVNSKLILLKEFTNYYEALEEARKLADFTKMTFRDFIKPGFKQSSASVRTKIHQKK